MQYFKSAGKCDLVNNVFQIAIRKNLVMLDLVIWEAMLYDHLFQSNDANKLKNPLQSVRDMVVHHCNHVELYFHRQTLTSLTILLVDVY